MKKSLKASLELIKITFGSIREWPRWAVFPVASLLVSGIMILVSSLFCDFKTANAVATNLLLVLLHMDEIMSTQTAPILMRVGGMILGLTLVWVGTFFSVAIFASVLGLIRGQKISVKSALWQAWKLRKQIGRWSLVYIGLMFLQRLVVGAFWQWLIVDSGYNAITFSKVLEYVSTILGMCFAFVIPLIIYEGISALTAARRSLLIFRQAWLEILICVAVLIKSTSLISQLSTASVMLGLKTFNSLFPAHSIQLAPALNPIGGTVTGLSGESVIFMIVGSIIGCVIFSVFTAALYVKVVEGVVPSLDAKGMPDEAWVVKSQADIPEHG